MVGYVPVLILFVFILFLAISILAISAIIGKNKKASTNLEPYECGIAQETEPRQPISIKFFAAALVFLLFDVEIALLYPWASLFRRLVSEGMGKFVALEGLFFIGILTIGLVYAVRGGVFNWEK